jgi:hypothetical protein
MRVLRCIFNYAAEEYLDKDGKPIITTNPVKRLSHSRAWNRVDRKGAASAAACCGKMST